MISVNEVTRHTRNVLPTYCPAVLISAFRGCHGSTIRIWDYTQDSCVNILVGHAAHVRGLMWNPEIPYLLISGSWDYTIRVWDTR